MFVANHFSLQFCTDEHYGDALLRRLSRVSDRNVLVSEAQAVAYRLPAGLHHVRHVEGQIVADDDCAWPRIVEVLLVTPTRAQAHWCPTVALDVILKYGWYAQVREAPVGAIEWADVDDEAEVDEFAGFEIEPVGVEPEPAAAGGDADPGPTRRSPVWDATSSAPRTPSPADGHPDAPGPPPRVGADGPAMS